MDGGINRRDKTYPSIGPGAAGPGIATLPIHEVLPATVAAARLCDDGTHPVPAPTRCRGAVRVGDVRGAAQSGRWKGRSGSVGASGRSISAAALERPAQRAPLGVGGCGLCIGPLGRGGLLGGASSRDHCVG